MGPGREMEFHNLEWPLVDGRREYNIVSSFNKVGFLYENTDSLFYQHKSVTWQTRAHVFFLLVSKGIFVISNSF